MDKPNKSLWVVTDTGQLVAPALDALKRTGKSIPSDKWSQLQPGQWLLVRLKTSGGVYYFQVLENKLGHPGPPCIAVGLPDGKGASVLLRKQIRSIATTLSPTVITELASAITGRR